MKARIKKTGEVVDVYYETQHGTAMTAIYKEATLVNGRTFTDKDIEIMNESQLEEHNHWQDVRERAAIAAMQGLLSNTSKTGSAKEYADAAIYYTDALIEELKRKEQ